jgi:hypothetical protein
MGCLATCDRLLLARSGLHLLPAADVQIGKAGAGGHPLSSWRRFNPERQLIAVASNVGTCLAWLS